MKYITFLLPVIGLFHGALALSSEKVSAGISSNRFIELDFEKEYTPGELRDIYRQQIENRNAKVESPSKTSEAEPATISVGNLMDEKFKHVPVNMKNYTYLIYEAECLHEFVFGHFRVDAAFNGYNVFWQGIKDSNVDKYGYISVAGGYGKPLVSKAEYSHRVCLQVKLDHMCSYYHFGVARATVNLSGKTKNLIVDTVQPDENVEVRPYVIETCRQVPMFGPKRKCPEPNLHKGHCGMPGGIEVSRFP